MKALKKETILVLSKAADRQLAEKGMEFDLLLLKLQALGKTLSELDISRTPDQVVAGGRYISNQLVELNKRIEIVQAEIAILCCHTSDLKFACA